jgi:hypothetical protein
MMLIESPRLRRSPFDEGGFYTGYFLRKIKALILSDSNTFSRCRRLRGFARQGGFPHPKI